MKCPNCGKENANDSLFCEYCGTKIKIVVNSSTDKPKVKWVQLILGVIGVVVGGYMISKNGIGLLLTVLVVIVGIMVYISRKK